LNNQVQLGYQLARVCFSPQTGDRLWLAGAQHPGNVVSPSCVQELIRAAEAQAAVRPRRRPELVTQRIAAQATEIARLRRLRDKQRAKVPHLQQQQTLVIGKRYPAEQVLKGRIARPKRQRLGMQVKLWQKRLPRLGEQLTLAQRLATDYQARLAQAETERQRLRTWQAQLAADHAANPNAPRIEARLDAGFASGGNLAWLLEMGYDLNTKSANPRTTQAGRAQLPRGAAWTRVGDNAEMILIGEQVLRGCPYPVAVALGVSCPHSLYRALCQCQSQ